MTGISAVIITFNEERNIGRCIASAQKVADEIIVIDSGSTDRTEEICRAERVRFIHQPWLGFGAQKNKGVEFAAHPYILSLDADELLDEELTAAILEEKRKGLNGYYLFSRLNYYYGKFIYHGNEYPDRKIRLYHRNTAQWNTASVHENLIIDPLLPKRLLKGHQLHYTYLTPEEHLTKANKYTSLAAGEYFERGKKASWWKLLLSPTMAFFKAYVIRRGFLDGMHGFVLARMHAQATFVKYAKLWSLHFKNKTES